MRGVENPRISGYLETRMREAGVRVSCENPTVLILGGAAAPSDATLACNAILVGILPGGHRALVEAGLAPPGLHVALYEPSAEGVVPVPAPIHQHCEIISVADESYVELLARALLTLLDCIEQGNCKPPYHPPRRCIRCGGSDARLRG